MALQDYILHVYTLVLKYNDKKMEKCREKKEKEKVACLISARNNLLYYCDEIVKSIDDRTSIV